MTTCHIAAIVKGLIEVGDGTAHFGSTMGYTYHFQEAVNAGVITHIPTERSWDLKAEVTERGQKWYIAKNMQELEGRCTHWRIGQPQDPWEIDPTPVISKPKRKTPVKKVNV